MKRLVFHVAAGLAGRFVTVRRSGELGRVNEGDAVALVSSTGEELGVAVAADCWRGHLALVPASILEMEQNPLHRTYSGLIMGLRAVGDDLLDPSTEVTALILDLQS